MADRVRLEFRQEAFGEILNDPGVVADLERRGQRVHQAAGGTAEGFGMSSRRGARRHRVSVFTATPEAMVENARDHTLIKALDAGRG